MTPYRDGKLLVLTMRDRGGWDTFTMQPGQARLAVLDPADDSLEELGAAGVLYDKLAHWLTYDAESDTVYLSAPGKLYKRPLRGEAELFAYLGSLSAGWGVSGHLLMMPDGRIAPPVDDAIYLRPTDGQALPTRMLTI